MSRKMLINARHSDELRVAIINNGTLEAYEVEAAESGLCRGNIYRGVVAKVEPSLNAAFIDYGAERHGFLPGDDVVPEAYQKKYSGNGRPKVSEILERGKTILVQVTKEAVGQKGAALTTSISLAGRYMVLTPFDGTRGVSRKVEDEEARKRLREQMASFTIPDGCGAIARTNAQDQNKTNLNRDLNALLRLWKRIAAELDKGKGPKLLYSDQDLVLQALRDYLDSSIEEVHVDDEEVARKAEQYMRAFMPRARTALIPYDGRIPLFARFHLDEQIDRIYDRTVQLPSGGSIVIDGTEALTAVDVNSGRTRGGNSHEDTVAKTNLEAAEEVARQLRMRDIGGLVVVDFIDMRQRRNHRKVEKVLRDAMKVDRARVSVGRISDNGLLEINRQRIKQALQLRTHRACPTCGGGGTIASPEFVALSLLRRIEARAAAGDLRAVRIGLHPELADGIQNNRRRELAELEAEYGIRIEVVAATHLHRSEEQVEWKRGQAGKGDTSGAFKPPVAALTASDLMDGRERGRRRKSRASQGRVDDPEVEETEVLEGAEVNERAEANERVEANERAEEATGSEGEEKKRPRRRRRRRSRRRGSSLESAAQGEEQKSDGEGSEDARPAKPERPERSERSEKSPEAKPDAKPEAKPDAKDQPKGSEEGEESTGPRRRRGSRRRSGSSRSGTPRAEAGNREKTPKVEDDNRGNRVQSGDRGGRGSHPGTGRGRQGGSQDSRRDPKGGRRKPAARPHVGIAPVKPTVIDRPPSEEAVRLKFGQPWYVRPVAESTKAAGDKPSDAEEPKATDEPKKAAASESSDAPKRRTRTSRAKKSDEAAPEKETTTAEAAEAGNDEAPKPKRRRASTRTKKSDDEAPAETAADDKASGKGSEEEAPKPRRRRASTRTKKSDGEAPAETVAGKQGGEKGSEVEAPKPRRRRASTRTKKSDDDAPAKTAAGEKASEKDSEIEAPKPRRRRASTRTKKDDDAPAETAAGDKGSEQEAPKPRRRRASTRSKKSDDETPAAAAEPAEGEAAKPRRRRSSTRKPAAEGSDE